METNVKEPRTVYTAAQLQAEISLLAVEFMKEWKACRVDETEIHRNKLLKSLGFTSSKSFKESGEKIKSTLKGKVFEWYRKISPSCVFLKTDDFVYLLQKYNLVCGRFGSYTGEIPYEKLVEINEVSEKLKRIGDRNQYSNKINNGNCIFGRLEKESLYHVFNDSHDFGIIDFYEYGQIYHVFDGELKREYHSEKYSFNGKQVSEEEYYRISDRIRRFGFDYNTNMNPCELFIAAPAQEMGSTIADEIYTKDPLVFQLFPYGVVIYSKWGNEGEDPILNVGL